MKKRLLMITPQTKNAIFRADLMKDIIKKGYDVVVIIPENEGQEFFKKNGIRTRLLRMDKNSTSVFRNILYYKRLKQIIKNENPDKVFSFAIKPVIFGSIAAHKAGVRDIYSLVCGLGYVYSEDNFKHKVLQFICDKAYRRAFKYNKKVIFQNSDDISEFLKRKNLPEDKCELVNGSGVNLSKFKRNDLPKCISFLMVSRILKGKGVLEYYAAAKTVKEKYPEAKFVYVGQLDGGQSAIRERDLKPFIDSKIIDYIPFTDDIVKNYGKCSVVVLPSYYREGIPRTLLEAMAMGRPIITTNTPGCRETIVEGKNGLFVKPRDALDLAEKMTWMIEHSSRLQEMGNESYNICLDKFTIDIINKSMMEIMGIN